MLRQMCKSKIHRAVVTEANLEYEGSITIDEQLMQKANLLPYERVQVANLDNGKRLETYVIAGPAGSGVICLNGAAAHHTKPGDHVHIISYAYFDQTEISDLIPVVLHLDESNHISQTRQDVCSKI